MTTASTLALCAVSSGAGALAMALFSSSRLSAAIAEAARYKAWWERDSARAIVAEAENDLTRQQRIDAGRQSHKAERARYADTALWLSEQPVQPLRPRAEIEAEVAARRAARANEVLPAVASPSAGIPADPSAGSLKGGSGQVTPDMPTGRGRSTPLTPTVAPQRQFGRRSCPTNRAVESAPAESLNRKGAI